MTTPQPTSELSRPIKVKGLPGDAVVVEADAGERAALARRFGLPGIDSLRAEIDLEQRGKAIRATGTLKAAIRQACAISGEDFPANIEEPIDLRFVEETGLPAPDDEEIEIELEADDCDEIEYSGDMFDLGEAVAQSLGLSIDPYAEGPNADAARKAAGIVQEGEQEGPLAAALAALKKS
ncbi:metal-binding protein [Erythrobacter sp. Dej080120_24]|uniref:YceD family protein n=1 Tax=Erythrobacter sp. Dej080120_24 TaxID=3024837 RepID=UPI00291E5238|nr:metal-binding protein [Erythrobacter sp. Dej080120_24]